MASATGSKVSLNAKVTLAILMVFYLMSFLDKQIFSLLATLIEGSLGFGDVQLGVLQGFAFSIPYSLGAILAGWAVDRWSKRMLLLGGLIFWSLAAASSGLAQSFESMALSRAGLGLGAAVLLPAGLSLIATVFPRDRVSGAIGLFYAGASIGGVFAVLLGGRIIDALVGMGDVAWPLFGPLEPWRSAFLITALPGVALAFLALGVRAKDAAPVPKAPAGAAAADAEPLWTFLGRHWPFYLAYLAGMMGMTICAYTIITWMAPYLGRSFGWSHTVIGQVMALGIAVGGCGNIGWGMLADRIRRQGHPDAMLRLFIPLVLLAVPMSAAAFLVKNPLIFLPAYALTCAVFSGYGSISSAIQLATPNHLRGRITGLQFVSSGIIGLGAGPVVAGFFTEHVFQSKAMLGPAIFCSMALAGLWAALWLSVARPFYLRAVREQDANALAADMARAAKP